MVRETTHGEGLETSLRVESKTLVLTLSLKSDLGKALVLVLSFMSD